jgi:hypothetical protein
MTKRRCVARCHYGMTAPSLRSPFSPDSLSQIVNSTRLRQRREPRHLRRRLTPASCYQPPVQIRKRRSGDFDASHTDQLTCLIGQFRVTWHRASRRTCLPAGNRSLLHIRHLIAVARRSASVNGRSTTRCTTICQIKTDTHTAQAMPGVSRPVYSRAVS